ncbi:hypothetical protein FRC00_009123, partial [Tulasnella sp. 408]
FVLCVLPFSSIVIRFDVFELNLPYRHIFAKRLRTTAQNKIKVPLSKTDDDGNETSAHPCKATGIAYISLYAATATDFTALCAQLSLVLGENPRFSPDGEEARWTLNVPQGGTTTTPAKPRPEIVLRTATASEPDLPIPISGGGADKAWLDQVGFWVDLEARHAKDDDDDGAADHRGGETGPNLGDVSNGIGQGKVAFVPLPRTG